MSCDIFVRDWNGSTHLLLEGTWHSKWNEDQIFPTIIVHNMMVTEVVPIPHDRVGKEEFNVLLPKGIFLECLDKCSSEGKRMDGTPESTKVVLNDHKKNQTPVYKEFREFCRKEVQRRESRLVRRAWKRFRQVFHLSHAPQ